MVALASMSQPVGTLIVGGGIAGCALAYYLAQEGETDVLLVEADELGSGSTGGSFGGVRQQFSTPLEIELSRRGLDFWRTAERVFDSPVAWHRRRGDRRRSRRAVRRLLVQRPAPSVRPRADDSSSAPLRGDHRTGACRSAGAADDRPRHRPLDRARERRSPDRGPARGE